MLELEIYTISTDLMFADLIINTVILEWSLDGGDDDASREGHPDSQAENHLIAVYGRAQMWTSRGRREETRTQHQKATCRHESIEGIVPLARSQASDSRAESARKEHRHQADATRNGGGTVYNLKVLG